MADPPTFRVTADHIRRGRYEGPSLADWHGDIVIAPDLGWIEFPRGVKASGNIEWGGGTGVKVTAAATFQAGGVIWAHGLGLDLRNYVPKRWKP